MPLITALFAVGSTLGLVVLASHVATIPDYTAPVLVLVGLGVGIDYALLVFSRYRSELLLGADRAGATRTALTTAGRSVLFAGATVIIALLGLYVLGLGALQGIALGVTLTVLMTMLASLTLLPSLLTIFGRRLEKSVRKHAAKARREPGNGWRRWATRVRRAPWLAIVGGTVVARRPGRTRPRHAARLRRRRQRPPEHDQPPGLRPDRGRVRTGSERPAGRGDRGLGRGRGGGVRRPAGHRRRRPGNPAAAVTRRRDPHQPGVPGELAAGRGDHAARARPARRPRRRAPRRWTDGGRGRLLGRGERPVPARSSPSWSGSRRCC